jgi:hypothetical protein
LNRSEISHANRVGILKPRTNRFRTNEFIGSCGKEVALSQTDRIRQAQSTF